MKFLSAVAMAFSMFSRIPVSGGEWKEDNLRWALCALPLVGAVIGLALWGWTALSAALRLRTTIYAVGLTLLPVAVSGGIHLDGLCDVADALACQGDQARMREVRKDPRVGAFGVIWVVSYLLTYYALCTDFATHTETALVLLLLHMASRGMGALCTLLYPEETAEASQSGLLHAFKSSSDQKIAVLLLLVELAVILLLAALINLGAAVGMLIALLLTMLLTYRLAVKRFGGMNGDLAGFAIEIAELTMLFFVALV